MWLAYGASEQVRIHIHDIQWHGQIPTYRNCAHQPSPNHPNWMRWAECKSAKCLELNVDWFQPFTHTQYSVGAMYLSSANLPQDYPFEKENVVLLGVIPGPKEPRLHINPFLNSFVEEITWFLTGIAMVINDAGIKAHFADSSNQVDMRGVTLNKGQLVSDHWPPNDPQLSEWCGLVHCLFIHKVCLSDILGSVRHILAEVHWYETIASNLSESPLIAARRPKQ